MRSYDTTMGLYKLIQILLILSFFPQVTCFIEGLYCGRDNCYDVLGVTRDSDTKEISRNYRKLAKTWHPDKHRKKSQDKQVLAEEMFRKIATAYEVLRDEESRKDYDYMLDNPDEYYHHYYRYYRTRVAPKVDVRLVIAVAITIISVIQYWSSWNNYNAAINYFARDPKYKIKAMEIAKREGMLETNKKKQRGISKEELREQEENVLRKVVAEKMDIRGSYSKPSIKDVLWFQLALLPWYTFQYIVWYIRWIWKFNICGNPYTREEHEYLIRRNMKLSEGKWNALEEYDREDFYRMELWIDEKFQEWKENKEEEEKQKLAESNKYKIYRRYMKRGGPGQMVLGPE
ncbi:DgyrCDS300 [Dimorphilus gyrociliatus]|uniref:DgyrCDS300 n=1 Tax=Dimorphilus gyrociliatus TaxID=2664684 RepID=A0A7I8V447_9ANNE|nr:DgyrCDS300 [Dimorphilus gyrociliatus]